jgi:hypothetical protein
MAASFLTINQDTIESPESGPTLWDVVTQLLGRDPRSNFNNESATVKGKICIDTPFGEVCWDIDGATAAKYENELKQIYLGSVLKDIFGRPRLSGACFEICTFGVCIKYCP